MSAGTVAKRLGVADYTPSARPPRFTTEWGEGTFDGTPVQLYQFASEADYLLFIESTVSYRITEAEWVRTGLVVIAPADQSKTAEIRRLLG